MKMLLLMLSLLLSVACGDKKSDEGLNDGKSYRAGVEKNYRR